MTGSMQRRENDHANRVPDVVLVDDDDIDIMALQRALSKVVPAPKTWVVHDGREALDLLESATNGSGPSLPCVVLLDLNMPRMGGFEFLEEVRSNDDLHDLLVFVLSTSNSDKDVRKAYSYNVAGYIHKSSPDRSLQDTARLLGDYCNTLELPAA